jgi:hypothetical protein
LRLRVGLTAKSGQRYDRKGWDKRPHRRILLAPISTRAQLIAARLQGRVAAYDDRNLAAVGRRRLGVRWPPLRQARIEGSGRG